jgi:hypothetical protein
MFNILNTQSEWGNRQSNVWNFVSFLVMVGSCRFPCSGRALYVIDRRTVSELLEAPSGPRIAYL